jgi:HSP20 family protein
MPGVGPEDVKLSVTGSTVLLSAERGSRRYRREIALPFVPAEGAVSHSCSEGVVDIIIQKPGS